MSACYFVIFLLQNAESLLLNDPHKKGKVITITICHHCWRSVIKERKVTPLGEAGPGMSTKLNNR